MILPRPEMISVTPDGFLKLDDACPIAAEAVPFA
jgi:hypothetical protein